MQTTIWSSLLGAAPGAGGDHGGQIAALVLSLAVILVVAKLAGDVATRLRQPAVLGELMAGVLLGNLPFLGRLGASQIATDPSLEVLAQLGVLVLLFQVGLESTVAQMLRVGLSSLLVALLGVATPFALGWAAGAWLLPQAGVYVHLFLGATLTATSVGITARVLQDLDRSQTTEARIILGAAVIDDVLGLMILAVVTGVISAAAAGSTLSYAGVGWILAKSVLFLVGALALGTVLSPRLFGLASRLHVRGVLLALGLAFCFLLAWLAAQVGLAPIVGAFAAGLILEDVHYQAFVGRGEQTLEQDVKPIADFLVPVFFVLMGMRTDLRAFANPAVLGLAAALSVAAVVGKLACAGGALGKGIDRLSIAVGMIPRGEVGLIFANIGLTLSSGTGRILDPAAYSAVVIMVIATTLVTPPALRWTLQRRAKQAAS